MNKKIASLVLAIVFIFSMAAASTVLADTAGNSGTVSGDTLTPAEKDELRQMEKMADHYQKQWQLAAAEQEKKANALKELGLFAGTNNGFELDRVPDRSQAAVMVVRLLGKEQYVKEAKLKHPFKDVPAWASDYIGYMYQNKLTSGISSSEYGAALTVTADQYTTFLLRVLGYSDAKGDFSYKNALDFAADIDMLDGDSAAALKSREFLRGGMVDISYASLSTTLKGKETRLVDKLITEGVVAEDKAKAAELNQNETRTSSGTVSGTASDVVSFDTGFTVIRWLYSGAIMYMEKSKLPAELQKTAHYFGYTSIDSEMSLEEAKRMFLDIASKTSPAEFKKGNLELNDTIVPARTHTSTKGKNPVITLYDKDANLIGIRIIKPEDFASTDSHYIQFEVTFSVKEKLSTDFPAFVIKKYINGVEDKSFDSKKIEGSNPRGSSGTSGVQVDYKYMSAPLFVKDASVTYEYFIDLGPNMQRNISKMTYDWEYGKSRWPQFVEAP